MGYFTKVFLILTAMALPHFTLSVVLPRKNPMASVLQNIVNPANAEKARQILQMTGVSANKMSAASPVLNLLQEIAVPNAKQVVTQMPIQRKVVNQVIEIIQPKMQEIALPVAPVVQEIYPTVPTCSTPVPVVQDRVYPYPYPYPAPLLSPPAMINPFLPAASPVSAIAPPTSPLLPPVDPRQVRSHYLRKIPIPPPSL